MELPFAVDASLPKAEDGCDDASSLVTASSQCSLVPADEHLNLSADSTSHLPPASPLANKTQEQHAQRVIAPVADSLSNERQSSGGSRMSSVISHFVYGNRNSAGQTSTKTTTGAQTNAAAQELQQKTQQSETEVIDFAYVNVTDEDEVDIWLDDNLAQYSLAEDGENESGVGRRADILTVLLAKHAEGETDQLINTIEQANQVCLKAATAKKEGNLQEALDRHTEAAKLFHEAALVVKERDCKYKGCIELLKCNISV